MNNKSKRSLRSSRLSNCSLASHWQHVSCCKPGRRFVNFRWTFSRFSISFLSTGFQSTEQYSRRGRTYVVKALTRLLISRERKHFKIRFAILCPLTVTLAICFENLTPLFMVTPRSTNSCTVDKTQLSTVYVTSDEWWRSRIKHLLYEIGNCQVCDHSTIRFKSSCNECGLVHTFEYNLTSSAKSFTHVSPENKSLIWFTNKMNSRPTGPRQLPCTTPLNIGSELDRQLPILVWQKRWDRKLENQFNSESHIIP